MTRMMNHNDGSHAESDPPDTELPRVPDDDPELEPVDGEAVVVPGQRPGPTEPLPISTEM